MIIILELDVKELLEGYNLVYKKIKAQFFIFIKSENCLKFLVIIDFLIIQATNRWCVWAQFLKEYIL